MSSPRLKNYLIVVLFATTASSCLIAWNQARQLTALNDELLKASASAKAVKPMRAPVAAAFTDPATPAKTTIAEVEPAAPAEASDAPRQRGNRPNFTALMANPEFAKAMGIQQRAALDARYAALFKQLNLSPAELEKFKSLLVERQSARMDVMAASRESGLNPKDNRDEINKLVAESQAEIDANIKTALGDARFNQYQSYDTTQPQRNLVSQLDQRLSYSSTPLNSMQSAFLVNALAASSAPASDQPQGGPGNWGGGGNRTNITDAVIQQAQSVLTPDQVAALKQLQAEQQAQQQIRDMMKAGGNATRSRN